MTYNEFIQNIIDTRGQWNIPDGEYFERHHIIPVCLGGSGDYKNGGFKKKSHNSNCIWLYPREHYIAHKLLVDEYPNNVKILKAYTMMCSVSNKQKRFEYITPEEYENLRKAYSTVMKLQNPSWSDEFRKSQSERMKNNNPSKLDYVKNKIIEKSLHKKQEIQSAWELEPHYCVRCGVKLPENYEDVYGSGKYCSRHCASSRNHTEETKNKLSEMRKGSKNYSLMRPVVCLETGIIYESIKDAISKTGLSSIKNSCRRNSCGDIKYKAGDYH